MMSTRQQNGFSDPATHGPVSTTSALQSQEQGYNVKKSLKDNTNYICLYVSALAGEEFLRV